MTVKEQVRKMLEQLPDECAVEDVQYQLYLIEKVRRGLKSIEEGKGVPHEQVRKQFGTWTTASAYDLASTALFSRNSAFRHAE